jgi:hypothetical protein
MRCLFYFRERCTLTSRINTSPERFLSRREFVFILNANTVLKIHLKRSLIMKAIGIVILMVLFLVFIGMVDNAVTIKVGDYVVAKTDIDLRNYNDIATSISHKPVTCHAVKGEVFKVTSSGDILGVEDQLNGCSGGAERQYFKLVH